MARPRTRCGTSEGKTDGTGKGGNLWRTEAIGAGRWTVRKIDSWVPKNSGSEEGQRPQSQNSVQVCGLHGFFGGGGGEKKPLTRSVDGTGREEGTSKH